MSQAKTPPPHLSNDDTPERAARAAALAKVKFDAIDLAILDQLQSDSKITNAMLAQKVGISPPSTLERVKKLENAGVIKGYRAIVDHKAVNKTICAFVHVTLRVHGAEHIKAFDDAVAAFDEIQGAWHTTGDEDFMLRVLVTDMDQYERFIVHRLSAIPNIGRVRTSFILSPVKDETRVPLDAIGGGSVDVNNL
jgi:Lrp/AsnC family transcriptional regulator, leucine-responsive regulatory protein